MVLEPANIRSLLIRAWRERWSDIQWGMHIKTVLPRYISGDIYQLSDCLLQQALMGTLPNDLILSYLRHSLASQIVSFGGVIESISKYDALNKPHCIRALLNILHSMMKNVSCRGKPEDCLSLASSLVAGIKWLIQVMHFTTEKLVELQTAPELCTNLNLANSVLLEILNSQFLISMLYTGYKEDKNIETELNKKIENLETLLKSCSPTLIENKTNILKSLNEIRNLNPLQSLNINKMSYDPSKIPYCHSTHSLVTLEVIRHTTRDAKVIARQLVLLKKFKGMPLTDLYLEILRTCFIGMSSQEYQIYQELKWVGFTYIKVPNIILNIHKEFYGESNKEFSEELHSAVKRLSSMVTLLDVADFRVNCNCLEYLLKEFIPRTATQTQSNVPPSVNLLSEKDAKSVLANRLQDSNFLSKLQNNESQGARPGNPDLILRAQPTVTSILKTLSNKATDSVMHVLSLLISGKSRELLLIAAASSGSLHIYAQKFVRLNEQSKESAPGETAEQATNRALVFDISFLLLCHIAQIYGTEVVVSEKCNTFIEQWIQDNIPESGKIKIPISPVEVAEVAVIEDFLKTVNSIETDSKYVQCKWNEVCKNATMSFREVMCAAHHNQAIKQMIFDLLTKFCCHICSLPICVAAWLCSHIQQVDSEEASLALEFLQYMQTTMLAKETTQSSLNVFKDRSNLMSEIIDHMAQVMKGPSNFQSVREGNLSQEEEPPSLCNMLVDVWKDMKQSSGLLTHKALGLSHDLLQLGGTKWFVSSYVKAALEKVFEDDLTRSIEVVYGLFHMDIVGCTLCHVVHTLPNYICGHSVSLMCETRTSALARLTAMLLISCWTHLQPQSNTSGNDGNGSNNGGSSGNNITPTVGKRGMKRTYFQREMEEMSEIFNHRNHELPFNVSSLGLNEEGTFFLTAVHHLFKLMTQVTKAGLLDPVTHLIVYTLKELVHLPHSSTLISLVPSALLMNLIPMLSKGVAFDYPQLLALSAPKPTKENSGGTFQVDLTVHSAMKDNRDCNQTAAKMLCIKRYFDLNA